MIRLRAGQWIFAFSQERLAAMLDVDESTVARWERGSRQPDAALLEKLEVILTDSRWGGARDTTG